MSNPLLSFTAHAARWLPMPLKRALYRFGPLARWIRSGLNRAAPKGYTQVQVAAGGLEGLTLLLNLQSEKDYWLGTYEPELQAAVAELVQPGMIAYDVGANIGYIALLLSRAVGAAGHVFAFEALPANLERLRSNITLNGVGDRIRVISGAVTNTSEDVQFLVGPSVGMGKVEGSAGRREVSYSTSINVPGIILDDFVYQQKNPEPQVVKMDIEGGEILALPGMRRLLSEARPVILIELHGPEAAHIVWDELVRAGYRICRMAKNFPAVPSLDSLDWKSYLVGLPLEE